MARLVSPTGKAKTLPGVRPNQGLEAAYRKKLDALIEEMQKSLVWWISAAYRAKPPAMAQDAVGSPAMVMRSVMRQLSRRWQKRFDALAPEMAEYFAKAAKNRADGAFAEILKSAGFTVKFKLTAEANDVLQATIGEQVGLIRSIASEHLSEVEGLVMRSVQTGMDLGSLAKALEERYGVTKRRAALISRDQNAKATASIVRVRQREVGITEAIWMHSGAGKHPRRSHVAMSGKRYNIAEGWFDPDAKETCWPGTLISCHCWAKSVLPGF